MQDGMEEIKQLFFEESDEGLDSMESGLLGLHEGEADLEIINDIFRAAHSIKGGAATFGFTNIAEFTHHAETLLDQMRDGSRSVTPACVDLLLKGVDCVREMMSSAQQGEDAASDEARQVLKQIETMHESSDGEPSASASTQQDSEPSVQQIDGSDESEAANTTLSVAKWRIKFAPHSSFLQLGNKPELILRELAELGSLDINACVDNVPDVSEIHAENCYVSWDIVLNAAADRDDIVEVFEWVDDDSDLEFFPLDASGETITADAEPLPEQLSEQLNDTADDASNTSTSENSNTVPATSNENTAAAKPKAPAKKKATQSAGSIRVSIDKIDALLNLVGELVITQAMLKKVGSEISDTLNESLENGLSQLESNARELQEVAMNMRMLPINNTFSRFPRMVHDLCKQLGKKVDIRIVGEQTELDKTVLEKVADPLVHLVRNALDHGIEMPEDRLAAGKPEEGTMTLAAEHEAGNIVISISDDGAGINPEKVLAKARKSGIVAEDEKLSTDEINHLIFRAGFSTAEVVSDVSGRGVGMDVVRRNIQDLGGRVEVESEFGKGSTFKIRLPLTMAILDGQLVRVGKEIYIVPLLSIVESIVVDMSKVNAIGNSNAVYKLRDRNIPIVRVDEVFGGPTDYRDDVLDNLDGRILVTVDLGDEIIGLLVDELLDQQQVVIKSLETNYQQLSGLAGATILGDGAVALILDISSLVNICYREKGRIRKSLAGNDQAAIAV